MRIFHTLLAASALVAAVPHTASAAPDIDPTRLTQTVRTLASDLFEGRAPGTRGEDRTIGYLVSRFEALGLEPGGADGQWVQRVPLLHTKLDAPRVLRFITPKGDLALTQSGNVHLSTVRPDDMAKIVGAPVVFVGYGVKAPERGWDDFKGVDLKGKVIVFLVNDPDFAAGAKEPVAGKFGGRTMTYY
ncbi:MAG: peptidase M20, partial [Alphaproteobacteria bacterium]